MEKLKSVFFYHLEKAIKSYRQYAQAQLIDKGFDVTIDQWLILKAVTDNPEISQKELAKSVFKDQASVTRIIDLLVGRKLLERTSNKENRRSNKLTVTKKGKEVIGKLVPAVLSNRQKALENLTREEIKVAEKVLKTIAANCNRNE